MILLAVTTDTWIVTGLGFGIVLVLLFCLVFIMQFFGWCMQKLTAPKSPKTAEKIQKATTVPSNEATEAAIAMALAKAGDDDDKAAIAYALYLYSGKNHDVPTAMIKPQARNTAWNAKEIGLNNKGF